MLKVRAIVFKQKSVNLYMFSMNAVELEPLCFTEAAARNKEDALQRVTEPSRLKEIGEYVNSGENALLPNNIILNLTPAVTIETDADGIMATVTFPATEGAFAFVVDGQHRLFSFREKYRKLKDTAIFDLPVVAFHNASPELVGSNLRRNQCQSEACEPRFAHVNEGNFGTAR